MASISTMMASVILARLMGAKLKIVCWLRYLMTPFISATERSAKGVPSEALFVRSFAETPENNFPPLHDHTE